MGSFLGVFPLCVKTLVRSTFRKIRYSTLEPSTLKSGTLRNNSQKNETKSYIDLVHPIKRSIPSLK